MHPQRKTLTNFSRTIHNESLCIRPDSEQELLHYLTHSKHTSVLARGAGLSYSDSCFNQQGLIIDTSRFNHFIDFDHETGIVVAQTGVTIRELLQLDEQYIPPVIPGTLAVTLGGAIAHDIHGKNNHKERSFNDHVLWFDLVNANKRWHCSSESNPELFYATLAGLGLTGTITRVALRLKKASHFVTVQNEQFSSIPTLIDKMLLEGLSYDYQVAWLDLLHKRPRAILSLANHCLAPAIYHARGYHQIPKQPFRLINKWNMRLFNTMFYHCKKSHSILSIEEFNNPLDKLIHWNYLYGKKGLLQFQAVFPVDNATNTIEHLLKIINQQQATPTLSVLKLFTQPGLGLLSFCQPGLTLAIDFIANSQAKNAIKAMNEYISVISGRVYLAKDLLLTPELYQKMYPQHQQFKAILTHYIPNASSNLSNRLGITS